MAATCTETLSAPKAMYGGKQMVTVTFDWLSHTDGAVTNAVSKTNFKLTGWVSRVVLVPDTGGTAPATPYNLYLKDGWGATVGYKTGASTTLVEDGITGYHIYDSTLELAIDTAGSGKGGTVYVIVIVD